MTLSILNDQSVRDIINSDMSYVDYVATSGDILYYTNVNTHAVTCCDLHGTTQWEFKDNRALHGPLGISADNDGNVYVVDHVSRNIVVISPAVIYCSTSNRHAINCRIHWDCCQDFLTFYIYYYYTSLTSPTHR
jgi:DNA-binding beta-propeller fold protein YncE